MNDKIQKIIEELRLYCGMDENGQLIINKLLEALSDSKDTEPCNLRKCKHYDVFFDDNCGGSNMENCIILEEQSKDTDILVKILIEMDRDKVPANIKLVCIKDLITKATKTRS